MICFTYNEIKSSKQTIPVNACLNSFLTVHIFLIFSTWTLKEVVYSVPIVIYDCSISIITSNTLSVCIALQLCFSIWLFVCTVQTVCLLFADLLMWCLNVYLCYNLLLRHIMLPCLAFLIMPNHFLKLHKICTINVCFLWLIATLHIPNFCLIISF